MHRLYCRWQWPWHWAEWVGNATVTLDWRAVSAAEVGAPDDVCEQLRAIPEARVAHMRRVIARNAHRMHWAAVDTAHLGELAPHGDAFDVTLSHAWAHARDEEAVARGRTQQGSLSTKTLPAAAYGHGHCGETAVGQGAQCAKGDVKGSWSKPDAQGCVAACKHCAQCAFVSYSPDDRDCSWFTSWRAAAAMTLARPSPGPHLAALTRARPRPRQSPADRWNEPHDVPDAI